MQITSHKGGATRGPAADAVAIAIAADLDRVRRRTLALVQPLPDELLRRQVRDFMSPIVWDLGHVADFERLWLVDAVEGRADARLEQRFDALATPRATRGQLDLPDREGALARLADVRAAVLELLSAARLAGGDELLRDGFVYRMVMQHEAQHQETMLQALDLMQDDPRHAGARGEDAVAAISNVDDEERVSIAGGAFVMGTEDRTRAYDNERRRHPVELRPFAIERYPVSNRRWAAFIDDGGYQRSDIWSPAGQQWLAESGAAAPQGWSVVGNGRRVQRFGHLLELDPAEPVQHVCYWEAEAFAAWCGGRLPSEAEWEKVAAWAPGAGVPRTYPWGDDARRDDAADGALLLSERRWGPPRLDAGTGGASAYGVEGLLGSVYQWTSSEFRPYPGFEAFPYAGYSEVFFGDAYRVLRGSSWAADEVLWRNTYRNWDLPQRRQIFAGVRVVYDV